MKEKLEKLLTAEQKKTIEEFRPGPPMGPPPGGPGNPPDMPPPPRENGDGPQADAEGGIQWFATLDATLDAGLTEAQRTGKPALVLSAAPHCGGVPGMW